MTDYEAQLAADRADRIAELQIDLKESIETEIDRAEVEFIKNDLLVTAPLSQIVEWAHEWRSEIEELGEN